MMTPATLRNMRAAHVWQLRDELIDAREDGAIEASEGREQIDLLANMAEMIEEDLL